MKKTRYLLLLLLLIFVLSVLGYAKTYKEELLPTDSLEYTLEDEDRLSLDLFIDEDLQGLYEFQIIDMSSASGRTPKLYIEVLCGKDVIYTYETESPFDSDKNFIGDKFCFYLGLCEGEYKINIENKTPTGDITFKIDTHFEEADYVKITPNDSFETATQMEIGKKYIGGNSRDDEFDYFYFDMQEDGYAFISMNSTFKKLFYLYDENGNEIGNIPVKIEDHDLMYELRTGLSKGRYYIGVVTEEDYNHDAYYLEVNAYSESSTNFNTKFEKEYNNEKEFATQIDFNKHYQGNLFGVEDLDIYSFDVKNDSEIVFDFTDSKVSKDAHYSVSITDGTKTIYENKEQKNNSSVLKLEKGTYYILVSSRGEKYFTNMAYSVMVNHKKDLALTPSLEEPSEEDTPIVTAPSFSDVTEDKWYYKDITEAAKLGLVQGVGGGLYNPSGNVTVAEAITMAVRVYIDKNDIQNDFAVSNGDKWYSAYVGFAKELGMIDEDFSDFERPATREEIAHFFAAVFRQDYHKDMTNIELLKKYSILKGDPDGQMHPERNLTRAEAAAILLRVHEFTSPLDLKAL